MRYVKINPHPDASRKSGCGRLTYVECGLPCANGHQPVFILEEGAENNLPAWAAAELAARGHEVVEINEVADGAHVARPDLSIDHIDVAQEVAAAPYHEVDRFLRHHGFHDHLKHHEPEHQHLLHSAVRKAETAAKADTARSGVTVAVGYAPFHSPEDLRAKALELCGQHYDGGRRRGLRDT